MSAPPIPFRWNGDGFEVVHPYGRTADRYYVIGETYLLVEHKERSAASHRHYFAAVNEAFANLPELWAAHFQTADQLRKFALIKTGYCRKRSVICESPEAAARVASFISPAVGDEYALVVVDDCVVTEFRAYSQSQGAMDRETFQASKDAVLGFLAEMIGVEPDELAERGRAA